jgi:hypothetical protein
MWKPKKEKMHPHHWTLNHLEDGEIIHLSPKEHGWVHGIENHMAESMAIKREIIFELAKEIPPKEIAGVVNSLWKR